MSWNRHAFSRLRILAMIAIAISARFATGLICAAVGLPQDVSGVATLGLLFLFVSAGPFSFDRECVTNLASIAAMRRISFGYQPTSKFALPDWSARARGAVVRVHFMMLIVFGVLVSAAFLDGSYAFSVISVLLVAFTVLMATTIRSTASSRLPR